MGKQRTGTFIGNNVKQVRDIEVGHHTHNENAKGNKGHHGNAKDNLECFTNANKVYTHKHNEEHRDDGYRGNIGKQAQTMHISRNEQRNGATGDGVFHHDGKTGKGTSGSP